MKFCEFQIILRSSYVLTVLLRIVSILTIISINFVSTVGAAPLSVADTLDFQGRLLSMPGDPAANQSFDIRFSMWPGADFVDGVDRDPAGNLINSAWEEVLTIVTDSQGYFIADVGSINQLPSFDANLHKYLQAEVKPIGQPNSSYLILDNKSADDSIDRKNLGNSAYSQNSAKLEGMSLGLTANEIPYLDQNGKLDRSLITDDSWLDPVADLASLEALNPNMGDIAYVTGESRLYSFNGSSWMKLGIDYDGIIGDIGDRLDVTEGNIHSAQEAIIHNIERISSLQGESTQNQIDISEHSTRLTGAENRLDIVESDLINNTALTEANQANINVNGQNISTNVNAISNNAAGIANNNSAIFFTQEQINANHEDITGNALNIGALQNNIGEVESNISLLDTRVTGAETELISQEARITTNEGGIQNRYTKQEIDNILSEAINSLAWRDSVDSFFDLAVAYPDPQNGWTAYVSQLGEIYTFNGNEWVKTGASFFQNATEQVAGKVILASDGEITEGKVVQGNDSRLAQVSVNSAAIDNNGQGIIANLNGILATQDAVGQNVQAIGVNTGDIGANTANIGANANDIDSNEVNINSNATNIETNEANIGVNANNIGINASDIQDLKDFNSEGYDVFVLPF